MILIMEVSLQPEHKLEICNSGTLKLVRMCMPDNNYINTSLNVVMRSIDYDRWSAVCERCRVVWICRSGSFREGKIKKKKKTALIRTPSCEIRQRKILCLFAKRQSVQPGFSNRKKITYRVKWHILFRISIVQNELPYVTICPVVVLQSTKKDIQINPFRTVVT